MPIVDLSVVVPIYNEETVLEELYQRLTMVLKKLNRSYEIIFVDDGSKDGSWKKMQRIQTQDECFKTVKLRSNFGQTAGISAGIDYSSGTIVIPMDGDLQHAPEDLPKFLEKIDQGYDIVSGWREKRVDGFFLRRIPSLVANRLMKYLSGISLHDFGTTYKAYRRDVISQVRLYGQFHRFIPVLCNSVMRLKICEIPIKNIVRPVGESNYGLKRTFTVLFDLIRLKFLMSFLNRPLQMFGSIAFSLIALSCLLFLYILFQRIVYQQTLVDLGSSIFLLTVFVGLAGLQFLCFGLLAELLVKLYYDGLKAKCYVVESSLGSFADPIHKSQGRP